MPFPLTPVPSYYATVVHSGRSGLYYPSSTVSVTLSQPTPTDYKVYDYYGNTVETGHVNGTSLSLVGPFNPGWYRVYMTGASTDATYGPSYGAWSFAVLPSDSRFVTNPVNSAGTGSNQGGGEAHDVILKGVLGLGLSRIQITNVPDAPGIDNVSHAQANAVDADTYWYNPPDPAFDAGRGRGGKYVQFPNRTYDRVSVNQFANFYVKDLTVDGTKVFVQSGPGSSSGTKIQIYYPDSSTLVETYDNLAAGTSAQTAINGISNYVVCYSYGNTVTTQGPLAIGNTFDQGVQAIVAALYPYGYTYFEGPINEGVTTAETAQRMRIFQNSVHNGNPNAKAIGPCFVDIQSANWTAFLTAGGASYCDAISTHMYNSQTNGDINLGRTSIETWQALLVSNGAGTLPVWSTEATGVYTAVYGVHHPRRSGVALKQTLLLEQYGVPRERNLVWYDRQHGFWSEPRWLTGAPNGSALGGGGPVPYAPMYRTLAAETFGMNHYHRLDFGSEAANRIWLGSLYVTNKKSLGASCLVLAMNSYMPSATVDLAITGTTANITYVDAFGNTTSVAQTGGIVTIPTSDIPTYVRLPAGVTATVHQVNDWGTSPAPSISSYGSASNALMNDDGFMTHYANSPTGVYVSTGSLPEDAQIMFLANATFQRVIIFCGGTWQHLSALTTFTVDTWDGASWTTQKSVDVSTGATSFQHGSDSDSEGCKQETYWPEQWIFDVKFSAPVTALGVRVHATACSYGGEPDAAAIAAGGQGTNSPMLTIQEIMVPSTSTPGF